MIWNIAGVLRVTGQDLYASTGVLLQSRGNCRKKKWKYIRGRLVFEFKGENDMRKNRQDPTDNGPSPTPSTGKNWERMVAGAITEGVGIRAAAAASDNMAS